MRIRSVSLEGFGPFTTKQVVDFRAFDADGLFLIAGETGAGKSSILDAIAYALYNKTPRWDNVSGTGASNAVRSDFCGVDDPTEVIVEFETNGEEYRVSRSPEYEAPGKRGVLIKRKSTILVEVLEDDVWVGKATKEREAAEMIESLLKLNKDEFLQVIMLAQGRFQEFLLANSEQRLDLLSKLFGTKRFDDYQRRITERRSALHKKVESADDRRAMLLATIDAPESLGEVEAGHELDWVDGVIAHATGLLQAAALAIDSAEKREKAALERLDIAKRQVRREGVTATLAELALAQGAIGAAKTELARAERAERVRPLAEDAVARREAWERAGTDVEQARSGYSGPAADDALAAEVSRLAEEVGTLTEAVRDEQRAEQLDRDHTAKQAEVHEHAAALGRTSEAIGLLQSEREALIPVAAQSASAADAVTRITARLDAATKAADIAGRLTTAQEARLAADRQLTAARTAAEDILDRFLHGQAAVLAATLVTGEPCAVCGATEHPTPATFTAEPVAQRDVDAAHGEVARLEPAATSAKEAVDRLTVTAAQLSGAAGEGDVATLTASAAEANAQLTAATDAAVRIAEIDDLLGGESGLVSERSRLESANRAAATELTALATERDALARKVARLRGDHPTVKARSASLVAERDGAILLAEAIVALGDAAKQRSDAEAKLVAKLAREKFESAEEVDEALLDEDDRVVLQQRIDEHAATVSENQGILKQPDLQDLPHDIIAVADASEAHGDAQRETRSATTAKAKADSALAQLTARRTELATLLAETQQLLSDYTVLNRLAETVNGRTPNTKSMSLESYYLAAELEEVLSAANLRLSTLSQGRFEFRHTERGVRRANVSAGLEIEVFDEFTGSARPANQLSGGQQFLASLALALGLAEVVTSRAGGIELNTLFVDEGFGGLSEEYLEIAMETLDSLKQGGRTVGVISHVASMQEQIGAQLRVVAEPGGPSRIEQQAS